MLLRGIHSYSGIFIACGPTDLRKSVDGLSSIVRQDFKTDEGARFSWPSDSEEYGT